jgi:hypothetical protein
MMFRTGLLPGLAVILCAMTVMAAPLSSAPPVPAVDISPHRALYSMSLDTAKATSGVVGATGAMVYEWGETCDGWTVEQRFRLRVDYAETDGVDLSSSLVTWESKDGLRYRFNERRLRNGELDEEVRGTAHLDGPGKGGVAEFERPENTTFQLAPGVLFPTMHTIVLINRAFAGDQFVSRNVFDGSTVDNATQITAVIGPKQPPGVSPEPGLPKSPLLDHPSWRVRLAFFPADSKADQPDYELGMRLLDNGVSRDMSLDYSDYVIKAKLDQIEALPKPNC